MKPRVSPNPFLCDPCVLLRLIELIRHSVGGYGQNARATLIPASRGWRGGIGGLVGRSGGPGDVAGGFPLGELARVVDQLVADDDEQLLAGLHAFLRIGGKLRGAADLVREAAILIRAGLFPALDTLLKCIDEIGWQLEFDEQRGIGGGLLEEGAGGGEQALVGIGAGDHIFVVKLRQIVRLGDLHGGLADSAELLAQGGGGEGLGAGGAMESTLSGQFFDSVLLHIRNGVPDDGELPAAPRGWLEQIGILRAKTVDAGEGVVLIADFFVFHVGRCVGGF